MFNSLSDGHKINNIYCISGSIYAISGQYMLSGQYVISGQYMLYLVNIIMLSGQYVISGQYMIYLVNICYIWSIYIISGQYLLYLYNFYVQRIVLQDAALINKIQIMSSICLTSHY